MVKTSEVGGGELIYLSLLVGSFTFPACLLDPPWPSGNHLVKDLGQGVGAHHKIVHVRIASLCTGENTDLRSISKTGDRASICTEVISSSLEACNGMGKAFSMCSSALPPLVFLTVCQGSWSLLNHWKP